MHGSRPSFSTNANQLFKLTLSLPLASNRLVAPAQPGVLKSTYLKFQYPLGRECQSFGGNHGQLRVE